MINKTKQIPTVIGLLILLSGIGAGVFLIQKGNNIFIRASSGTIPKQVKITNITDSSFSVSWITDSDTLGFIKYGTTADLDQIAKDERDESSGKLGNYTTHHINLKNLNPATTYQFKINSGNILFDNNGQNYRVTTGNRLTTPSPPSDTAYGNINNPDGSPAYGAIVYLSIPGAITQSTLVKNSGNWIIPLNLARSTDLNNYANYDKEATIEEILVQGGNKGMATAITTTKNDSPLPPIVLGESYDFRTASSPPVDEESSNEEKINSSSKFTLEEITSFPTASLPTEVTIINPQEQEKINTQLPEIIGRGPAGEIMEIKIESPQSYTGTIIVDEEGNWKWTPPDKLEPGKHTITITYNNKGQKQTFKRSFIVLAAGTSDLPSLVATPSGEILPTSTPSPTLTPTSTPTSTLSPTATPSSRITFSSTESAILKSGYLTPTFMLFIIGLVMIIFGVIGNISFKRNF